MLKNQIQFCLPISAKMTTNKFGEIILSEDDLCGLIMQGRDLTKIPNIIVDRNLDLERMIHFVENPDQLLTWTFPEESDVSVPEFDNKKQNQWYMPESYKQLDIAAHLLELCQTDEQLQRVGQELLMYQEHDLFDLLRYLKYLVDRMRDHKVIWGVGRGSSVSSYILYLIGVHKIDSMFYDLDPREFLR